MRWIDTHCHLFTAATAQPESTYQSRLHDTAEYLAGFGDSPPEASVVVDFSKALSSAHVLESLEALHRIGHPARGIIRGRVKDEATLRWLAQPSIAGIRLYALGELPDFSDKVAWDSLFNRLRASRQHVSLFASSPALFHALIQALPQDLTLLIDHLGMPDITRSPSQTDYARLLQAAGSRNRSAGAVYLKGPGTRNTLDPARTRPFWQAAREALGEDRLLLGASDAPFAGPIGEGPARYQNQPFQLHLSHASLVRYLAKAAQDLSTNVAEKALMANAAALYGF